jgi:apolipoprotein N-acyltransferase
VKPRRAGVAAPSLVAGVALALSVPPWGFWPLAFVGAGLLFWRLEGLRPRTRLLAGWCAGLGCFVPGLFWAQSFNWYGAVVLMAIEALAFGLAALATPPEGGRIAAFVGAFTLAEGARMQWPFGGLPLGGVFLGQVGGPLRFAARLGGPLLLTALIWAGGAAVATVVVPAARALAPRLRPTRGGAPDPPRPRRTALVWGGVAALGVIVLGITGALSPDGGAPVRHLAVAAVQGGGRRGLSKEQVAPATVFAAQLAATRRLVRGGEQFRPALVVWPEDVISPPAPLAQSAEAATMRRLARTLRATVLVGVTVDVGATQFRNEVVVWGPGGRIVAVFEKVHRVPFGEYVPFRSFFARFADLSEVPLDAIPGDGTGLLRTPAAPIGVLVSFEVFYPARIAASVAGGAELLVVPTNTSSYSTSQVPSQEVAAARLQAIERGRDLVQASPTGFSAIIDNAGTVRLRSGLGSPAVLEATVGLRTGMTVYDDVGDLPVVGLCVLALIGGWWRARRLRRAAPG